MLRKMLLLFSLALFISASTGCNNMEVKPDNPDGKIPNVEQGSDEKDPVQQL